MNQAAVKLPAAIVTLCDEHRYMNLLVETLDNHIKEIKDPDVGDYFLMQDIVRYMHDYSDSVHHPTEDLMFDKLVKRNPAREKDVARLRREHDYLDKSTSELKQLIKKAKNGQSPDDAEAAKAAAKKYIRRLRRHMKYEEDELFPSAIRCLAHKDWHNIEMSLDAADDPLFGQNVQREYRVLYEYFADRSEQLSHRVTKFGFLQLDNMIVSVDTIEAGISEMWQMLQDQGTNLRQEFREVTAKSSDGRSLASRLALQTEYAGFVGKTALATGGSAAGIYFRTLKNALTSLVKGAE